MNWEKEIIKHKKIEKFYNICWFLFLPITIWLFWELFKDPGGGYIEISILVIYFIICHMIDSYCFEPFEIKFGELKNKIYKRRIDLWGNTGKFRRIQINFKSFHNYEKSDYLYLELDEIEQNIDLKTKYLDKIKIINPEKIKILKDEISYYDTKIKMDENDIEYSTRKDEIRELEKEIISVEISIKRLEEDYDNKENEILESGKLISENTPTT
tara:strand:+ start:124 stop:762 length:639 start_codon:yes stop_codon:yes gene_type:complete